MGPATHASALLSVWMRRRSSGLGCATSTRARTSPRPSYKRTSCSEPQTMKLPHASAGFSGSRRATIR